LSETNLVKDSLASLIRTDDPGTGDIYSGLDRFGWIKDCRWYNTDAEEDAVRLQYGYDRNSNRLWRQDDVARALSQPFDELYTYDGLQRLKTMLRGLLNGGHDAISNQTYGQCWNLDATENWTGMKQAEGGSSWTLEQSRDANPVNEITEITNSVGPAWAQPAYDPAGNMTTIPTVSGPTWSPLTADDWSELTADGWGTMDTDPAALTATWDAWNRLVKLVDSNTEDTIAEYQYDANNRIILKKLYANNTVNQTRHIYLSTQNQVLEERVDESSDAALQNIWGLMYIDGLVLRDRFLPDEESSSSSASSSSSMATERRYCLQDANWNAVALTDETGTVTQRFCYQPYGTCQFLEPNYDTGTNTSEWTTLFTGRELDRESKLYYFRARDWHPSLGNFISRDLLSYIDGAGLYIGYFVPNGVDPSGNDDHTYMTPFGPMVACVPRYRNGQVVGSMCPIGTIGQRPSSPSAPAYPAGAVTGLADHLKSSCCTKYDACGPKEKCESTADSIQAALEKARDRINATGGVTRFDYAGNVCTECANHAETQLDTLGNLSGFFNYRQVQKVPWVDTPLWAGHVWLEITCPNTGEIVATVDFWVGSGDRLGWTPGEDGFGWTPNSGRPGQPIP
jgi:RHS repeat-associated core domain